MPETCDSREDRSLATESTFVAGWRRTAAERGDAVAVQTPDESVTYRQALMVVEERALVLGAAVRDRSRPIAVDVESDVESVLSILAVLCSGHPVIVLDPFLPDARRDHILGVSGAYRLTADDLDTPVPDGVEIAEPGPDDPAVLIFTSGSTGAPKGVVHGQRAWVNQAADGRAFMGLGPGDRAATLLPLSFGAGFDCLVMTMLNGSRLLLWDVRRRGTDGLRDWLATERATTAHCTPSLLRSWLSPETSAVGSLRLLSTCGESVYRGDVERVRAGLMPDGVFCSWSGSSEAGNLAFNPFPAERELPAGVIPVGTPASDKHVRIVGDDGADVPAGEAGEVIIESAHLALRYHDAPDLTDARFTDLGAGRKRYRTGDLGRFDQLGQLHLLGRGDDAIKIRGYLVEPVEVESAIRALPWTADAVVTADRGQGRLTAYIAVNPGTWSPAPVEIRRELAKMLSPWMIPRDIVVIAELPRTERGKVDRAALPAAPGRTIEPMRGLTEANLEILWLEVLALDAVGRTEDFLALGGDSLAAATLLARVRERWFVDIPTAEFAEEPTIAGLGRLLDEANRERARTDAAGTVVELRGGEGRPMFIAAGAGAPAVSLLPLVRELGGDFPVYGLQAHGLERRGRADRTIRAAARRAIRDIRRIAPDGPYRLAGYSYGGFVMLEAAARLVDGGARCDAVILLDALFEPELLDRICGGRHPELSGAGDRVALPDRTGVTADTSERPNEDPAPADRLAALRSRVLMRTLVATAGLVTLPTATQWTVFWDLGRQLIRRHRPAIYRGPVVLVRAASSPANVAAWSRLVTGGTTVVPVAGDHHSMLRTPLVAETAAAIDAVVTPGGPARERNR
nr:AMP-binding protein [Gordonia amarae]